LKKGKLVQSLFVFLLVLTMVSDKLQCLTLKSCIYFPAKISSLREERLFLFIVIHSAVINEQLR